MSLPFQLVFKLRGAGRDSKPGYRLWIRSKRYSGVAASYCSQEESTEAIQNFELEPKTKVAKPINRTFKYHQTQMRYLRTKRGRPEDFTADCQSRLLECSGYQISTCTPVAVEN
jgi:hypothetical protein